MSMILGLAPPLKHGAFATNLTSGNIDALCRYYRECLEMHILRRIDFPEDKYMTVFMGYGLEDNHLIVELTYREFVHNSIIF